MENEVLGMVAGESIRLWYCIVLAIEDCPITKLSCSILWKYLQQSPLEPCKDMYIKHEKSLQFQKETYGDS